MIKFFSESKLVYLSTKIYQETHILKRKALIVQICELARKNEMIDTDKDYGDDFYIHVFNKIEDSKGNFLLENKHYLPASSIYYPNIRIKFENYDNPLKHPPHYVRTLAHNKNLGIAKKYPEELILEAAKELERL